MTISIEMKTKTGDMNNASLHVSSDQSGGAGIIEVKLDVDHSDTGNSANKAVFTIKMYDDQFGMENEKRESNFKAEFWGNMEMGTFLDAFIEFGKALEKNARLLDRSGPTH